MTRTMLTELAGLYEQSKIALANAPFAMQTKWDRMLWAAREFHRVHPEISERTAYLAFHRAQVHAEIPGFNTAALDHAWRRH